MLHPNEILENPYYILTKRLFKILAFWPYQTKTVKRIAIAVEFVIIHSMLIPQAIRGIEELGPDGSLEIVIENFCGFLFFESVLFTIYSNAIRGEKLKKIYELITVDFKTINNEEERNVLLEYSNVGSLLCKLFIAYVYFACVFFVWMPIFSPMFLDLILPLNESRPKSLCYYAQYYVDQQKYLYYFAFHTFICVGLAVSVIGSFNGNFVACVYHGRALSNIIKFADVIQDTFGIYYFYLAGTIILGLSIGTMDLVYNLDNPVYLIRIGFLWCGAIASSLYVAWPGQRLADDSTTLFNEIYFCGWYKLPIRTQNLLKFMLMRCTIPCQVTAGPLLQLNLEKVGGVLKLAMSYFTVVVSCTL